MDVRWGEQKEVDRKRRKTIDDIMVAGGRELIDTLWNVNETRGWHYRTPRIELIDTLWNVNVPFFAFVYFGFQRINRYIMECKCQKTWTDCRRRIYELIDTLWNVNWIAFRVSQPFCWMN